MKYKIKKFILGTSQLNQDLYNKKKKISVKEIKYIFERSIAEGINCFDTAPNYGNTQKVFGQIKKKIKDKVFIFSKSGFVEKNRKRNFEKNNLLKNIHTSLRNMKLDYLDSFFLNKPSAKDIINNDLIYFLEKQKKIGNIKNAGLIIGSNYNYKCFYHDIFKYYSVLYNLINTEDDKILKKLKKLKKKVLVRSPFNSGILTSKFILKGNFDKDDYRYKEIYGFDLKNKKVKLDKLFNKFNFNFSHVDQIALSFLINNQNVDHIIFGPSKLKHIMDILYSRKKYKNYINSKLIERIIFFNKFLFNKYPTKSQFN